MTAALPALAACAGIARWTPPDLAGTCCGTVWHSKGHRAAHAHAARDLVRRLWAWSDGGRLPVVVDAASRTLGIARESPSVLTIGLGLSYGPMPDMYAEMLSVSVRSSGVAIGYALGAIRPPRRSRSPRAPA
uniref:Predicted D-lactate dehydrogenase, Fe-S protein, FAD/FMN-containing n=1 Tax=Nonomuraea gerenzanensis TaxID=93944 RepID=A0A1M4E5T1_9ACTN|nr:Predicted D-lactate dehydrogenase, Fe-S protein, FAD/FMN-containing [Nonomuraea gerenzanensis]